MVTYMLDIWDIYGDIWEIASGKHRTWFVSIQPLVNRWETYGKLGDYEIYPLANVYITMEYRIC